MPHRPHLAIALMLAATLAHAQNPVPQIVGPAEPTAVAPGSGTFTLSVYGANFVFGSVVNWNYQPRSTSFVSAHELHAQILATDVAANTAGMISVTNPSPGGGNSSASWVQVEVHDPVSTLNFEPVYVIPLTYDYTAGFLMADFTGSGILDMWADSTAMLGNGEGKFHFGGITDNYYPPSPAIYADFNGDGKMDLAYVAGFGTLFTHNPQVIDVLLGDGNGKFQRAGSIEGIRGSDLGGAMAAGDFNRDGKMDIVAGEYKSFAVYAGNGDGTFQQLVRYAVPGNAAAWELLPGDFNGDGILDLVIVNSDGHIYLLIGKGDGTFEPTPLLISHDNQWSCGVSLPGTVVATDLNHDGKLDLLACGNDGEIGVFLGNGDGTFQSSIIQFDVNVIVTVLGDFNSDGNIDLLISEFQTNPAELWVLWGNGDGTFQSPQVVNTAGVGELGMAAADLNADGLLDYVQLTEIGLTGVYLQQ